MTSWHGHRDDEDIPSEVRELWQKKFQPGSPQASNVDVAVLDKSGKVIRTFGAIPVGRGGGDFHSDRVKVHWQTEIAEARKALKLKAPGKAREVELPGLAEGAQGGLRVFTRLDDPGMPAYNAPVVEVVGFDDAAWEPYHLPKEKTTVDASELLPWLSKMFPGGVMERTDPDTKRVYDITGATGTLEFATAGSKGEEKFALLTGRVTITDSGGGGFSFSGELRIVLTYRGDVPEPASLRGTFEGRYPRKGPQGRGMEFPITGVVEKVVP